MNRNYLIALYAAVLGFICAPILVNAWSGSGWDSGGGGASEGASYTGDKTITGSLHLTSTLDVDGTAQVNGTATATIPALHLNGSTGTINGTGSFVLIAPTHVDSSVAAMTDLLINRTQTSVGSGAQLLLDAQVGGVSKFSVSNTGMVTIGGDNKIEIRNTTSGSGSFFIGNDAGSAGTHDNSSWNVAVGENALKNITTADNAVAIGANAGSAITYAPRMVAIGSGSFQNTTGEGDNTGVGFSTGNYQDLGSKNTLIGSYSGSSLAAGSIGNTAVGAYSLYGSFTAKNRNIAIGTQAGESTAAGADDNIIIGYNIDLPSSSGDGQLNIGNLIFGTSLGEADTTLCDGNVGIGIAAPTARLHVNATTGNAIMHTNGTVDKFGVDSNGNVDMAGYLTGNGPIYAGLHNNSTTTITEALTDATYVEIIDTVLTAATCVATHTSCDATNDNIDIVTAGTYDVSLYMSFSVDGVPSSELVSCAVFKEGAILENVSFDRTISSTAYGVAAARGIVAVSANDTFDVRCSIADASPPNMLVTHINLNLIRLGD